MRLLLLSDEKIGEELREKIKELFRESWSDTRINANPWGRKQKGSDVLVAMQGEEPKGVIMALMDEERKIVNLHRLFTAKSNRGRPSAQFKQLNDLDYGGMSLASQIEESILAYTDALGMKTRLDVMKDNKQTLALHRRYGFKEVEDKGSYVIMEREPFASIS